MEKKFGPPTLTQKFLTSQKFRRKKDKPDFSEVPFFGRFSKFSKFHISVPFGCTYPILPVDTIGVHTIVTQKLHDVYPPGTRLWNQNSKFVEKSKKSQFENLKSHWRTRVNLHACDFWVTIVKCIDCLWKWVLGQWRNSSSHNLSLYVQLSRNHDFCGILAVF